MINQTAKQCRNCPALQNIYARGMRKHYSPHGNHRISSTILLKRHKFLISFSHSLQEHQKHKLDTNDCRITTRSTTQTENPPEKPCVPSAPVYILRLTNSRWHHFHFHSKVDTLPVQASLSLSDNHRKCRTRSKRVTKTWALGGRAEEDVGEKDLFLGLSIGWFWDFVNGDGF